jgi:hypothetical protein
MFLTFNDPKNTAGPRVGSHLLRSSRGLAENQKTHPTRLRSLAPGRILPQGCRVRNVNSGVRHAVWATTSEASRSLLLSGGAHGSS